MTPACACPPRTCRQPGPAAHRCYPMGRRWWLLGSCSSVKRPARQGHRRCRHRRLMRRRDVHAVWTPHHAVASEHGRAHHASRSVDPTPRRRK
eukprot:360979-Chlamydomonas_euryale.AAC.1